MIKIKEIKEPSSYLFAPDGRFVGEITSQLQLDQVRVDIKHEGVELYSILFYDEDGDKHTIEIRKSGCLDKWPKGFYDAGDSLLDQLM